MLDTKLKNRHKLAVVLIICTILTPTLFVMAQYHEWNREQETLEEAFVRAEVTSEDFLRRFVEASYIQYYEEDDGGAEWLQEEMPEMVSDYGAFYPYLDYRVLDENDNLIGKSMVDSDDKILTERNMSEYAVGMIITYDENGVPTVVLKQGKYLAEQSRVLRSAIGNFKEMMGVSMDVPKNRTYMYAMTEENLQEYLYEWAYDGEETSDSMWTVLGILFLFVAAAAWIYPMFACLHTGSEKIFHVPFEITAGVLTIVYAVLSDDIGWLISRNSGYAGVTDFLMWILVFAVIYWTSACLQPIRKLGFRRYVKEHTVIGIYGRRMAVFVRHGVQVCVSKIRNVCSKIYHSLENIDLRENGTKTILKIVGINFVILAITCSMWFFGIMALVIYSVILFFLLRKYYLDIQGKYALLLKVTGEIAKGNLDAEITDDLGIFNPFKPEIEKIQSGFKKAVKEEVKSQRMKTELITNVSHDLKTPLTAIITYVNLLKDEKDEEKKKEYIDVLERKSLRLKSLIEDLFEISKASSENVALHIMDVDIVHLFKQVKLELEEKIEESMIEFRCSYPDERIIVPLDSQKTYRIFENLLVNISKYALPHTRAYVEIKKEDTRVVIQMKNVSKEELKFNPEEITERFVRGDASRNTEGNGLGLAIAKSFTELQKGTFRVETEADLFKVEIQFGT